MCYELRKPFEQAQKDEFIFEYNRKLGLRIQNTDMYLFALEANEIMGEKEIVVDDETITIPYPIVDPDYDEKQKTTQREYINSLTCTKRVFALMLQKLGIDYLTQLKPLIESNPQAQLEWELCIELLRENPLLDLMCNSLGVTSEQLDMLFLYANGELEEKEIL